MPDGSANEDPGGLAGHCDVRNFSGGGCRDVHCFRTRHHESLLNMGMWSPETVGHDSKAIPVLATRKDRDPLQAKLTRLGHQDLKGREEIRDLRVFKAFRARSEKAAHPGPKETKALLARLASRGPRVKPERRDPRATRE